MIDVNIDAAYVKERLQSQSEDMDLQKYIM
jgi:ATP-dependent protease HslVU (ClpYQ) ATPase subunit